MSEHEPTVTPEMRLAPERMSPDWRRLEVASHRFEHPIANGIAAALAEHREVDHDTARCIAHALGRALGRESALAEFGRTGESTYLDLREEYLRLYTDEDATAEVKELIDWFGTYLIDKMGTGSGRTYQNEHLPPKLDRLLVRTTLPTSGRPVTVHVPASLDAAGMEQLIVRLEECDEFFGPAFRAFLALPDVNAAAADLLDSFQENYVGSFNSIDDAVYALSPLEDWEIELGNWADDHSLPADAVHLNIDYVIERTRDVYDFVEEGGMLYAFNK